MRSKDASSRIRQLPPNFFLKKEITKLRAEFAGCRGADLNDKKRSCFFLEENEAA